MPGIQMARYNNYWFRMVATFQITNHVVADDISSCAASSQMHFTGPVGCGGVGGTDSKQVALLRDRR